jgi:hypothetical protein
MIAPHPQGFFLGFRLESIPLIERPPSMQQILESGVGTPAAEKLPNVVEVVWQEFTGEVQRQRLPEVKLSLVRYWEEFLGIVNVIRQYVQVVTKLGMPIELARLLAQKNLVLVTAATSADEFESFPYVIQADRHGQSFTRSTWRHAFNSATGHEH